MSETESTIARPPVLGTRAATQCARKTHNDFDLTIPRVVDPPPVSPGLQLIFDQGNAFETEIREQLMELLLRDCVDIGAMELYGELAVEATVGAMAAGMPVILRGWLPTDAQGGRSGKPDVLVRVSEAGDLDTRYVPVDIKGHKTLQAAGKSSQCATVSSIAAPYLQEAIERPELTWRKQEKDALQLAHYWRMLEACGRAPDRPAIGGIIGTDDLDIGVVVFWRELERPEFKTFSRSDETGKALRSAMERYDHEFGFRSKVATAARQRTGAPEDPTPLVEPIRIDECDACIWFDYCDNFSAGDASFAVGKLSAREWVALRSHGYSSLEQFTSLNVKEILDGDESDTPTGRLLADYLPEVANVSNAKRNLVKAVKSAQMVVDGVYLRRESIGAIDVPRADIEIDFDIEFDTSPYVYLWGIFITDRATGSAHYEHFSHWGPSNPDTEFALGVGLLERLQELARNARATGQSMRVYDYSSPESQHLRRVLSRDPVREEVAKGLIDAHFVDLHPIVNKHFVGRDGLGLKQVATHGAGFNWQDDDPGGFQSLGWHERAQAGDSDAITRLLAYNEDDVRATWAVREWLDSGPSDSY